MNFTTLQTQCYTCMPGYKLSLPERACSAVTCNSSSQYYEPLLDQCVSCPAGCSSCTSRYNCTGCLNPSQYVVSQGQCMDKCLLNPNGSFYFNSTINDCSFCTITNCVQCKNSTACAQCSSGYTIDPISLSCDSCQANCRSCVKNSSRLTCTQCSPGFTYAQLSNSCDLVDCSATNTFYVNNSSLCDYCDKGCSKCVGKGMCTQCAQNFAPDPLMPGRCVPNCSQGYYYDSSSESCTFCLPYCKKCNSSSTCEVCKEGFYPNFSNQKEIKTLQAQTCLMCPNYCSYCYPNTTVEDILRAQALDQSPPVSYPVCGKCQSGFKLTSGGDCVLDKCPSRNQFFNQTTEKCEYCLKGCAECLGSNKCSQCFPDFIMGPGNTTCVQINTNKTTANATQASANCSALLVSDGQCKVNSCILPGCGMCDSLNKTCLTCREGFSMGSQFAPAAMTNVSICLKDSVQCPHESMFFSIEEDMCLDCPRGCSECKSQQHCTRCEEGMFMTEFDLLHRICLPTCPLGFFPNTIQGQFRCVPCAKNCLSCMNKDACLLCDEGFAVVQTSPSTSACVKSCPSGTFLDLEKLACMKCHDSCGECFGPESKSCLTCAPFYFNSSATGLCTNQCSQGANFFVNASGLCQQCDSSCKTCVKNSTLCTTCNDPMILNKALQTCQNPTQIACPSSTYFNTTLGLCQPCDPSCYQCTSSTNCAICAKPFFKLTQQDPLAKTNCVLRCPRGFYADFNSSSCQKCSDNCVACESGVLYSQGQCLTCANGTLLFNGTCVSTCPQKTFSGLDGKCHLCGINCDSCNATQCLACTSGFQPIVKGASNSEAKYRFFLSKCTPILSADQVGALSTMPQELKRRLCPPGTFLDTSTQKCTVCNSECALCDSQSSCSVACNSSSCADCFELPNRCLACQNSFTYSQVNRTCLPSCNQLPGQFLSSAHNNTCMACGPSCAACLNEKQCTKCAEGSYLFMNNNTNMSICLPNCTLLNQPGLGWYANLSTQSCMPCSPGCEGCRGDRMMINLPNSSLSLPQCDKCRIFSHKEKGRCFCGFAYKMDVILAKNSFIAQTFDINWVPALHQPEVVPCSQFFQLFANVDPMLLFHLRVLLQRDIALDQEPQSEILKIISSLEKEVLGFTPLDLANCRLEEKQVEYFNQVENKIKLVNMQVVIAHNVDPELLTMLLDGNLTLRLRDKLFMQERCLPSPLETYALRVIRPKPPMLLMDSAMSRMNQSSMNESMGVPSIAQMLHQALMVQTWMNDGNTSSSDVYPSYMPVDFKLNTAKLVIEQCLQSPTTLFIAQQVGFYPRFESITWNIQVVDSQVMSSSSVSGSSGTTVTVIGEDGNPISTETNADEELLMAIQDIMEAAQDQSTLDFGPFIASTNLTGSIVLNVDVIALSPLGVQIVKTAVVEINLMDFTELLVPKTSFQVIPTQPFSFVPMLKFVSCMSNQSGMYQMTPQMQQMLPPEAEYHCTLLSREFDYITDVPHCIVDPSMYQIRALPMYYLGYHFQVNPLREPQSGMIALIMDPLLPMCKIQQGASILVSQEEPLHLNASLSLPNTDSVLLRWSCTMIDANSSTGISSCLPIQSKMSEDRLFFRSSPGTLEINSIYFIKLALIDKETQQIISQCEIKVTTPADQDRFVIGIGILSPANERDYIDPAQDIINFECIPVTSSPEISNILNSQSIQVAWWLNQVNGNIKIPLTQGISRQSNILQVATGTLLPEQDYEITCMGSNFFLKGFKTQRFTTKLGSVDSASLNFTVSPATGDSVSTLFNLSVSTSSSKAFKCSFGYIRSDLQMRVILKQLSTYLQNGTFGFSTKLPSFGSQPLEVFLLCLDPSNNPAYKSVKIQVSKGTLDSAQIQLLAQSLQTASTGNMTSDQILNLYQQVQDNANSISTSTRVKAYQMVAQAALNSSQNLSSDQSKIFINSLYGISSDLKENSSLAADSSLVQQSSKALLSLISPNISTQANNSKSLELASSNTTVYITMDKNSFAQVAQAADNIMNVSLTNQATLNTSKQLIMGLNEAARRVAGLLLANENATMQGSAISLQVVKVMPAQQTQLSMSIQNSSNESAAAANTSLSSVQVSINSSDPVFSGYGAVVFQAIVTSSQLRQDSITPTSQSVLSNGTKHSYSRRLASDILILNAQSASSLISTNGTYSMTGLNVTNLVTPIYFNITVKPGSSNSNQAATGSNSYIIQECLYFDVSKNDWLSTGCQATKSNGQLQCCSTHMTEFVIRESAISSQDPIAMIMNQPIYASDLIVVISLIVFDIFFGIFGLIGFILDRSKKLILYLDGSNVESQFQDLRKLQNSSAAINDAYQSDRRGQLEAVNQQNQEEEQEAPVITKKKKNNGGSDSKYEQRNGEGIDRRVDSIKRIIDEEQQREANEKQAKTSARRKVALPQQYEGGESEEDDQAEEIPKPSKKESAKRTPQLGKLKSKNKPQDSSRTKKGSNTSSKQQLDPRELEDEDDSMQDKSIERKSEVKLIDSSAQKALAKADHEEEDEDHIGEHEKTHGEIEDSRHHIQPEHFEDGQLDREEDPNSHTRQLPQREPEDRNAASVTDLRAIRQMSLRKQQAAATKNGPQGPRTDDYSSGKTKGELADLEVIKPKSRTFCQTFALGLKVYHRLAGVLFSESPYYPRPLKTLNAVLQFYFILCLSGIFTVYCELERGPVILVTLAIMRAVQIILNILPSKSILREKAFCRNIIIGIIYFVAVILGHVFALEMIYQRSDAQAETWARAFIGAIFIEIIIFDTLLIPIIAAWGTYCCKGCFSPVFLY